MNDFLTLASIKIFLPQFAKNSKSVYWLSDPKFTNLTYISPAYEDVWGRSRQALYDDPSIWIAHLHPDDRNQHPILEMKHRVMAEGMNAFFVENYRIIRPNGEVRWILDRGFPVCNQNGKIIAVSGVATDVTPERKYQEDLREAKEKAQAANKAKSEFIANMSHDLRTPMTGVSGMLDGIVSIAKTAQSELQSPTPDVQQNLNKTLNQLKEIQQRAQAGYQSSDILMQLLNEILDTIQLESGKVVVPSETFNVRDVIQQQIDLSRALAEEKHLQLSLTLDDIVPRYLLGPRQYLDRTLLNLVSNALKFTETGFVSITVTVADPVDVPYKKSDSIRLKITVKDSGIGIPKDKFTKIFEYFSRLTPSYEGRYKGYGLGLYTVKRYVDLMSGHIEVASDVGKGSCFTVTLPFTVDDHADHVIEAVQQQHPPGPTTTEEMSESKQISGAHILLVEDNPTAALGTVMLLGHLGCSVDVAETGTLAIERASNQTYDLIFMDIGLPDISGIDVTKKIRALPDAQKSQAPIVALTGHATNPDIRQDCLLAGINAVLEKPAKKLDFETILQQRMLGKTTQATSKLDPTATVEPEVEPLVVIDWEGSLEVYAGDEKATRDMLVILAKDLKKIQTVLADAYKKKDTKVLHTELHRCLSGVVYLKLPQLEHAIRAFHKVVKSITQNDQKLELTYLALQNAIEAFCEEHKKIA